MDVDIHRLGPGPPSCMLYTHKHTHSHKSTLVCGYVYTCADTQVLIYHTGICIHEQAQALLLPTATMNSRLAWAMLTHADAHTARLALPRSLCRVHSSSTQIRTTYHSRTTKGEPAPLNPTTLLYVFGARAIQNAQVPPKTRGLQREGQHLTCLREGPLLWEACPFQGLS